MDQYFVDEVAVWILGFLTFLYVGQIVWAINDAFKPIEKLKHDDPSIDIQVRLYDCLKLFDGGMRNMWVFFVLAILLPVILSTMADLVPLFQGDSESSTPESSTPESSTPESSTLKSQREPPPASHKLRLLYIVCVGCIGVLMTLEFSYLHTLRKSAAEWIPMLLAALALDLMTLLVLNIVIRNPDLWKRSIETETVTALIIATIVAITSSFGVLVLARVAGALHDGQIDISKVIELISASRKYKEIIKRNSEKK